jgi:predicted enzyme related to lactoylglutathione lyase
MGERTEHAPGTFSWVDLSTTDPEAAKRFYSELLGWETEDMPAGEGNTYTMARVGGRYVAGLSAQPPAQRDAGVPPAWLSYVTVADVDGAAARAAELGGTVHAGPFDVLDVGRMAVVQDPQGAWFALWEPRRHIGAELVNAPGAMCWNQLTAPDVDGAKAFYGGLFGWTTDEPDFSPPYWMILNGDRLNGGLMAPPPEQTGGPAYWLTFFAVDDLDAAVTRVGELGGRLLHPVTSLDPDARFAVAADPQGAVFALYAGKLDE